MKDLQALPELFIKLMFGEKSAKSCITTKSAGVYYTKHKDINGTSWECKFKFKNGTVKWGMKQGRWRTLREDVKLSYKIKDGIVTVTETIPNVTSNHLTEALK